MVHHQYTVAAVEYLNTALFVSGFRQSASFANHFNLVLDYPAGCTRRLLDQEAEIGLVPVASLRDIKPEFIFPDYCIGADRPVRTVRLFSNGPIDQIQKIYLDAHSLTSVRLIRVLCEHHWKVSPEFIHASSGSQANKLVDGEAILLIGDKVFEAENQFTRSWDLAEEWIRLTNTHFVFAAWVSQVKLPQPVRTTFEKALSFGLTHREEIIHELMKQDQYKGIDVAEYLNLNISYEFDQRKRDGLKLFLELAALSDKNLYI